MTWEKEKWSPTGFSLGSFIFSTVTTQKQTRSLTHLRCQLLALQNGVLSASESGRETKGGVGAEFPTAEPLLIAAGNNLVCFAMLMMSGSLSSCPVGSD